jgi:sugar phosphate isomerase/epimerase
VDFAGVFKELKGYSGWIVVEAEQDPEKAPPAQFAKKGHDNLIGFIKASGLKR